MYTVRFPRTMKPCRALLLVTGAVLILLLFALPAFSQGADEGAKRVTDLLTGMQNALYPAPVSKYQIEIGYRASFRKAVEDDGYYKVTWDGKLLSQKGDAFKSADVTSLFASEVEPDKNEAWISLDVGTGLVDQSIVQFERTFLPEVTRLGLRGSVYGGYNEADKTLNITAGVESDTLRVPGVPDNWANWLVVGAKLRHTESLDTGTGDTDDGLLTYQAFAGRVLKWRKSDPAPLKAELLKVAHQQVGTFAQATEAYLRIVGAGDDKFRGNLKDSLPQDLYQAMELIGLLTPEKNPGLKPLTESQSRFVDAFESAMSPTATNASWLSTLDQAFQGVVDRMSERKLLSLYCESVGWYDFAGDSDTNRPRALFTATLDWSPSADSDRFLVRLSYENGYSCTAPGDRLNQLLASALFQW